MMERLRTGNAEVDRILSGGFPRHSINILMGQPGAGKTIFAEQLAFANADRDRPVVYVATLSESLDKFLAYLQQHPFGDTSRLGTEVIYESIDQGLGTDHRKVVECLRDFIQRHRPRVLIIDSFKVISDLMPDLVTWRRVLFEIAGLLTAYDVTSFWIGEYTADRVSVLPEFAVADGIVEFSRELRGSRDERYLRVIKLRGSGFLTGHHAFHIGPAGLQVFPRLVTPVIEASYTAGEERLLSGIQGLDEMIATGWLRGTSTLVIGASGAGKTVLGLHFLRQGVSDGEPGLLLNFQENAVQLGRIVRNFGWKAQELFAAGNVDFFYTSPVELQIDTIVGELFTRIDRGKIRRVVIDALGDLENASRDAQRFRDYIYAMTQHFAARNITSMLLMEGSPGFNATGMETVRDVSPMSDNVVLLEMRLEGDLERYVRVIKSRGSAHSTAPRPLRITSEGILVGADAD